MSFKESSLLRYFPALHFNEVSADMCVNQATHTEEKKREPLYEWIISERVW